MRLRGQSLTTLLVGFIALSYLVQLLLPGYEEALWISGLDFQQGEYWRLLTVALVHGGFFHLGFNLYALHILGTPVELYFGRNKYIIVLLTSLVFGSLASALFNDPFTASVGASGIVFGLFGSLALIGKKLEVNWRMLLAIICLNLTWGLFIGEVDWLSHLGGLFGGIISCFLVSWRR